MPTETSKERRRDSFDGGEKKRASYSGAWKTTATKKSEFDTCKRCPGSRLVAAGRGTAP
jgi:hypothetical protein